MVLYSISREKRYTVLDDIGILSCQSQRPEAEGVVAEGLDSGKLVLLGAKF